MLSRAPDDMTRCVSTSGMPAMHSRNTAANCGELDPEMPTTSRRGSAASALTATTLSTVLGTLLDHFTDQARDVVRTEDSPRHEDSPRIRPAPRHRSARPLPQPAPACRPWPLSSPGDYSDRPQRNAG